MNRTAVLRAASNPQSQSKSRRTGSDVSMHFPPLPQYGLYAIVCGDIAKHCKAQLRDLSLSKPTSSYQHGNWNLIIIALSGSQFQWCSRYFELQKYTRETDTSKVTTTTQELVGTVITLELALFNQWTTLFRQDLYVVLHLYLPYPRPTNSVSGQVRRSFLH